MIENNLIAPSINSQFVYCQVQTFGSATSFKLILRHLSIKLPKKQLPVLKTFGCHLTQPSNGVHEKFLKLPHSSVNQWYKFYFLSTLSVRHQHFWIHFWILDDVTKMESI